MQVII